MTAMLADMPSAVQIIIQKRQKHTEVMSCVIQWYQRASRCLAWAMSRGCFLTIQTATCCWRREGDWTVCASHFLYFTFPYPFYPRRERESFHWATLHVHPKFLYLCRGARSDFRGAVREDSTAPFTEIFCRLTHPIVGYQILAWQVWSDI